MEKERDFNNEQANQDKQLKSEMQTEIDNELQSDALKDMHLESGEKVNEYPVD